MKNAKPKSAKLTKHYIDTSIYEGRVEGASASRDVRWDRTVSGLGLRILPSGRKVFVLFYRINGRQCLYTLGAYGTLTLEQARKEAQKKKAEVIQGGDPVAARKQATHGETIADLCRDYMERHARVRKKSWRADERLITRYVFPAWGNQKVKDMRRSEVAAFHHKIGKSSLYEANRVLSLLSKMFECAREWGFLDEDTANPARGIKAYREVDRERWLTREEVKRLIESIEKEESVIVRALFWLYLLTGLRRSELLRLRWDNVELEQGLLRLPDTKAGRPHYLPLSVRAIEIFKQIPRMSDNPYVFPSRLKGRHLVEITKLWDRVRTRAELSDVWLHDIRRTVGSWLAQSGNSLQLIGKILNHTDISTTEIYARLPTAQVREALERHGDAVQNLVHEMKQNNHG